MSLSTPGRHVTAEESLYFFLYSALDGVLSVSRTGRFYSRKTTTPTEQEAEWAPESVRTIRIRERCVVPAGISTDNNPARSLLA